MIDGHKINDQNFFMRDGENIRAKIVDECQIKVVDRVEPSRLFGEIYNYGREELIITPLFAKKIFGEGVDVEPHPVSDDLCKKIKATRVTKKVVGFVGEFFAYGCSGIIASFNGLLIPNMDMALVFPMAGLVLSVAALPITFALSSIITVGRIIYYASQHSVVTCNDKKYFVRDDRYQAFLADIYRDPVDADLIEKKKFKHYKNIEDVQESCLTLAKQALVTRVNRTDSLSDSWNNALNQELQLALSKDVPDFVRIRELVLCGANPHALLYRGDLGGNFEIGTLANFMNKWKTDFPDNQSLDALSRRLPDSAKSDKMPVCQVIPAGVSNAFLSGPIEDLFKGNSIGNQEWIIKKPDLKGGEASNERALLALNLRDQNCYEETTHRLSSYVSHFPNSVIDGLEDVEIKTYAVATYKEFLEHEVFPDKAVNIQRYMVDGKKE